MGNEYSLLRTCKFGGSVLNVLSNCTIFEHKYKKEQKQQQKKYITEMFCILFNFCLHLREHLSPPKTIKDKLKTYNVTIDDIIFH